MRQDDIFLDVGELERRRQFRMQRLQVLNWGTFSGLHDIRIAEDGFLVVGRSGSGKSTLLDALGALLIPPQWLSFNAAARENERGRQDRNLASYVRGAWADQKDSDSGEIATRYLRPGTTWSALALTFGNAEGRCLTLIQLFWLKGAASGAADVKRHYLIVERPFEVATELEGFDLDLRGLKRAIPELEHYTTFSGYAEHFRRVLGIESEMALKLLHKTQSAKNLGDLNTFLREFMLERPASFDAAERLVAEFAELDTAHQAVVTARRQVDTLRPAREAYEQAQALDTAIAEHEHWLAGIDGYCDELRRDLLEQTVQDLQTRDEALAGDEGRQRERQGAARQDLAELEAEHRARGGAQIERLEQEHERAVQLRDERLKRRGQAEAVCRELDWRLPDTAAGYAERLAEARELVEGWRAGEEAAEARRDELRDAHKAAGAEFAEVAREVRVLERQPSNIPAHMLELRAALAEGIGCAETELPFAGELIEVRETASDWRGAIERVLRGFALSLLVDERRYAAVSDFVNRTHLGQRLVYYRVEEPRAVGAAPRPESLVHKLELAETSYRPWLEAQLWRRFDYACVEHTRDLRRVERGITREGQVRHGRSRHEKDDRSRLDDRRYWVLGFDNRDKLALYKQQARELGARIGELEQELEALRAERQDRQARFAAAQQLVNLSWQDIDAATPMTRVQELEGRLAELREGNADLRRLGERLEQQRQVLEAAEAALRKTLVAREQLAEKLNEHQAELAELDERLAGAALEPVQRQELEQRFDAAGRPTLKNLDARRRDVERSLNEALKQARAQRAERLRRLEQAFTEFKRDWPAQGADLEPSWEGAPEFLALLQRLERDGLPRHEQRFFQMLKEQSSENLAALNTRLVQARKDIRERMELVNEGLADAQFNPGTHLQIEVSDRNLPDVREFRERVSRILGHAWSVEAEEAERRFNVLRELVHRLGAQEPEHRRWREQVLDVRLHVEFIGRELDAQEQEVEIYRSGAGKSGGQREKLATTCLAAALRYQLGGADGGLPVYAPVVLDEAFGKADNEFTELAMKIFQRFGFQMIVATPLKSVMTLEPFIGGACFVDIAERRHSATLPITYDQQRQRLRLPAADHGEGLPA